MAQDVNCIYLDMPASIKSFTVSNPDMSYTIVLNAKHTREQHLISYHHEMTHIENGDFDKRCSTDLIEIYAHA